MEECHRRKGGHATFRRKPPLKICRVRISDRRLNTATHQPSLQLKAVALVLTVSLLSVDAISFLDAINPFSSSTERAKPADSATGPNVVVNEFGYQNALNYGRVSAGCRLYPPGFDDNVNECTNFNIMGSLCNVGPESDDHFRCKCELGTGLVVFPICAWVNEYIAPPTPSPDDRPDPHPSCITPGHSTTLNHTMITNGYIECETETYCNAKCDKGFIPEPSANKLKIYTASTCNLNDTNPAWTELAFTNCIGFQTFCNYTDDLAHVLEDSNTRVKLRVIEHPTTNPRIIGRLRADVRCRRENFHFSKINRACYRFRCECQYRHGKYLCMKYPEDPNLDLGHCEDVDDVPFTRLRRSVDEEMDAYERHLGATVDDDFIDLNHTLFTELKTPSDYEFDGAAL